MSDGGTVAGDNKAPLKSYGVLGYRRKQQFRFPASIEWMYDDGKVTYENKTPLKSYGDLGYTR